MVFAEFTKSLGNAVQNFRVGGEMLLHAAKHPDIVIARGEKPFAASVDIAANCNLRCSHCYLYGKEHQEEQFENQGFLEQVTQFRKENPGIMQCTWVGGEPMWRKELLREAVQLFPVNWVVTNGTVPIDGEWKNTAFFISIDGTRDAHNQIRQPWKAMAEGYSVYDRAKQTANSATAPVHVHTTINQINKDTIPALVAEWQAETTVRGFQFSLHTPQIDPTRESGMSASDERLFLFPDDRQQTMEMLLALKKQYGSFIMMSEKQILLLTPGREQEAFGANCSLPNGVVSLDSKFERKMPCVMGEGMDCGKCGCVIPTMVYQLKKGDMETMRLNVRAVLK